MSKVKKGDKVWINFMQISPSPEFEVVEVLEYGELCKLRHIKSGSLQKGVVRTERLIRQQNV